MRRPHENRLTQNDERLFGCHFAIEPRSSGSPVAFDRGGRNTQSLGSFFNRETGKESKFDNPLLLRIHLSQFAQRIIERNHIKLHRDSRIEIIMKRYSQHITAAFEPMARACMIDKQTPDHLRRRAEKVSAILPIHTLLIHQPDVHIVDQGRGLKGVRRVFLPHISPSKASEFVIHQGHQTIECGSIAIVPCQQKLCHIRGRGAVHH
jgi:hypothetical protein